MNKERQKATTSTTKQNNAKQKEKKEVRAKEFFFLDFFFYSLRYEKIGAIVKNLSNVFISIDVRKVLGNMQKVRTLKNRYFWTPSPPLYAIVRFSRNPPPPLVQRTYGAIDPPPPPLLSRIYKKSPFITNV